MIYPAHNNLLQIHLNADATIRRASLYPLALYQMVLFLARCWLYKLLQTKVLPTHQRAFFYADWSNTLIVLQIYYRTVCGETISFFADSLGEIYRRQIEPKKPKGNRFM